MKGFIFFETWFQAIEGWPDAADRAEAYAVLAQYALTGEEVEGISAFARAMLMMAKANIDKSAEKYNARSEAGRKGMSQRWRDNKRNDDATTVMQRNGDATSQQRCNDDTTMQRDGDATTVMQRDNDATMQRCNDNKRITNDNKRITNDNKRITNDNKRITNDNKPITNVYQTITDKDKDKDKDKDRDKDDLTPLTPLQGGDARERAIACARECDDDAAMQRCNDDATPIQRNNDASLHDVTMQRDVTLQRCNDTSQRDDTTRCNDTTRYGDATSQRYNDTTSLQRNDTTTVMQRDGDPTSQRNNTPPTRKTFAKPTLDELQQFMHQYADEHHTTRGAEQAQRFIDYYESNGWKVGRNPMKSWQAAARNWLNRQDTATTTYNNTPPLPPTPYSERDRGTFNEFTPTPNLAHDDRTPEQIQEQRQTPEEKAAILKRLRQQDEINSQRLAQRLQADNIRATQRQQQNKEKTMNWYEFQARQQQQVDDGTHAPSDYPVHMSKHIPGNNKHPPFQHVPRGTPLSDEEYEQVKQNKLNAYLKQKAQQDSQDNNTNNSQS